MSPRVAFCSGCIQDRPVDRHWRALWIDSDGDLVCSAPERRCDLDFERPGTVFACGQGCALILTERYLHSRGFEPASQLSLADAVAGLDPNIPFPETFYQ